MPNTTEKNTQDEAGRMVEMFQRIGEQLADQARSASELESSPASRLNKVHEIYATVEHTTMHKRAKHDKSRPKTTMSSECVRYSSHPPTRSFVCIRMRVERWTSHLKDELKDRLPDGWELDSIKTEKSHSRRMRRLTFVQEEDEPTCILEARNADGRWVELDMDTPLFIHRRRHFGRPIRWRWEEGT